MAQKQVFNTLRYIWVLSIVVFTGILYYYLSPNFTIHYYRQAQTAMTALYLPDEGFKLNYATPIMGYPWTVPMEFPFYQWLAVILQKLSGSDLVICGKIINITCHVINNFLIISLFKQQKLSPEPAFIGLIFYNVFPFYLVFDSVFLIDGFSLTLAFAAVYFLSRYLIDTKPGLYGTLFLFFATATGLSKTTTFIGVLAPVITVMLLRSVIQQGGFSKLLEFRLAVIRKVYMTGFYFVLSFGVMYTWVRYSDNIKQLNPLANEWTSANTFSWNFGTLQQRLSIENWTKWLTYSMLAHPFVYLILLLIIIPFLLLSNIKEKLLFLSFLIFTIAPLVFFFNLFFIHTYYGIANTIFLYFMLAVPIAVLLRQTGKAVKYSSIFAGIIVLVFGMYRSYAFRNQIMKNATETGVFGQLHKVDFKPGKNDVLVLVQPSRDPYLQYYFKCRGINLNKQEFLKYGQRDKLQKLAGGFPIRMICIVDEKQLQAIPSEYSGIMPAEVKHISLSHQPESSNYYNFFWY